MSMNQVIPALMMAEKAYQLEPQNFKYKLFAAQMFYEAKIFEMAITLLNQLLKTHPGVYVVHWSMAQLQVKIARGSQALPHFDQALLLCTDATRRKAILLERAICHLQQGDTARARKELKQLENDPEVGRQAFSVMLPISSKVDVAEMMLKVQAILSEQNLTLFDRSSYALALGKLHEMEGRHNEAFSHWDESRRIARQILGNAGKKEPSIAVKARTYSAEAYAATLAHGHVSERPIFIGGMARSGTTLVEQILAAHSAVSSVGELSRMNFLDEGFIREYPDHGDRDRLIVNAKNGELKARADETLKMLELISGKACARVVEKTPDNWLAFGYIHMVLPKAKLIHCQRNPADTFISAFQNLEGHQHSHAYNQEDYAAYYLLKQSYMDYWKKQFPESIFEIKYEQLVREPEAVVRALISFVGLPWEESCLRFFENKSTVLTYSHAQVRQPIYHSSIGRYKDFEHHLGPLLEALKAANFEYPEA